MSARTDKPVERQTRRQYRLKGGESATVPGAMHPIRGALADLPEAPQLDLALDGEALALLATFDSRLSEAEARIDRVLARLTAHR